MSLGGEDLIGLGQSQAGSASNPGPNNEAFNGAIGGGEVVDFGTGYQIPLDEFLEFGEVGAIQSESTATDDQNGEAITGIVGADGGLTLDGTDSDFGTARVDLLSIAKASGADTVTDQMVDQADLSFGLGGAWVESVNGEFQDPDAVGEMGQYRVGDMKLELHSPAVQAAGDGLSDAAGQMEQEVTDTINESLDLTSALPVPGLSVDTEVSSTLQEDVLDATLLGPIATDDGLAEINLGDGTVVVDLGRIGGNDDGLIDRPVGINNQNPNTELIDDETYPFIASSVHDVIDETVDLSVGTAMDSLESVSIGSSVSAPDGTTASWDMTLAGEVSNFECTPSGITGVATCATLEGAMGALGPVMTPINDLITNPEGVIYEAFTTIKTDLMTVPVRAALDPFLELIATNLFSVQINHQETQTCETSDGSEALSGLEVSALSIGVLDGTARLGIGNAGVRTDACGLAAAEPVVEAASPVPAGECTEITSSGWAPETEVTFQVTDAEGNPVGDPITATTDAEGNVPADTCLTVPEGTEPGDYTVVGEDPDGNTGESELTVYAPEAQVDSPAAPGECATVTSSGWVPGSEVTIQLTDAEGNPVGDPVTATADDEGNLPADTCVTIPEGTEPGDYEAIISDDNGAEIPAPVEVGEADADEATLEASSPVVPGDESTLTSEGWTPDTDVTVQLADPEGNPVGDPVTVTTDENGAFPEGSALPVPEDAAPGDGYTVTATDPEGTEATDTLQVVAADAPLVDASSPVAAGDDSTVSGEGWTPDTEVSVQLGDPEGNPLGDPVTVTTDENGAFPEGTVLPVPEDATPADGYTVTATDPEGNEATDTIEVTEADSADEVTIDASSPVRVGDESALTSEGWTPDTEVSVQLADPEGNAVGDPVTVTTDENGAFPEGSALPIPQEATPRDGYTITATDPEGTEATDTIEVVAPDAEVISLDAASPTPAGGESTLESAGWTPDTEVSVQLTDPEGNAVGDPVTVTTDENGAFPEGTVLPVPEDATPADGYTVTATDPEGNEATDNLEIAPADSADEATLEASSPVRVGDESALTSEGWTPDTEVSVQLTDSDGNAVGDPVTVTTDENGAFPEGTVLPVPEDATPGDGYTATATDPEGTEATDTLEVVAADAPLVDASTPAPAGGESTLTGDGWTPDTDVTVQLTDPEGNAVGDPVTVTTDENGAFPEGSALPIPEDAAPGDGYTVTASDPEGNEATDTLEIAPADSADEATLEASSPVRVGDESALTSEGWTPDTEVSVQLTDSDGNAVGDPVTVTTDENGAFPEGTVLPVPEDATPGDGYTATATDPEGTEATDTLEVVAADAPLVDASTPAPAGGESTLTGDGWTPDTDVTVQLADPEGNAVGDPVTVTTDENGAFPEGSALPIPEDAAPGDGYTVTASDPEGNEATDTLEIAPADSADEATLEASSPVRVGDESTLTSEGWTPDTAVSVQLINPEGEAVGHPISVTTDENGAFPDGSALPIPPEAKPGDGFTVSAGDREGNEATDTIQVVAADAPLVDASSPAPAGGESTLTGDGWTPGTEVSVQLADPEGNAVGDPVTVTTDENGAFPEGSALPIPEDATPADGYTVTATDPEGNEATDTLEVAAADGGTCVGDQTVTIEPDSVDAGGTVIVSGTGFAPGTGNVALVDGEGNQVGAALEIIEVGDDCAFENEVVVSTDVSPGDYELVVSDGDGNSASDSLTVTEAQNGGDPAPGGDDDSSVGVGEGNGNGGSGADGDLANTGFDVLPIAAFASLLTIGGAAALITHHQRKV
ncbi:hypothetical protein JOF43_000950 [Brachybacterium sacelli]|uniref:Uncharacterized protein n=2 Tax=Brachybacterium sacelli TaxID=173364 RepID=A0ABS4WYD7_9MICO|nr:hypothetical protein [Brachybacterium sacelli]